MNHTGCFLCRTPTKAFLCRTCTRQLDYWRGFRGRSRYKGYPLWFVAPYAGAVRDRLWELKYKGATHLAPGLGHLMAAAYLEESRSLPDWLVPMPMGPTREGNRGFNQSRLLAVAMGRLLGRPVADLLVRKDTRSLAQHQGTLREGVLRGSMKTVCGKVGREDRILVIDDIHTTGATLREAIRALETQGFTEVGFLFFARQEMSDNLVKWFSLEKGLEGGLW